LFNKEKKGNIPRDYVTSYRSAEKNEAEERYKMKINHSKQDAPKKRHQHIMLTYMNIRHMYNT